MKDKREAQKGFRLSDKGLELLNEMIKASGKPDGEWLEDIIQRIATDELVLEKSQISLELRKHFSSDVSALNDATALITNIFINQMNRIAVEKNNWTLHLQNTIKEFEVKQMNDRNTISTLEGTIQEKDTDLEQLQGTILQLQTKIEGFDKLEEQLKKNIERLELDKGKIEGDLQSSRIEATQEKEKFYNEISELKTNHKEEKDKLNQQIVDLVKQLKEVEPIKEESKTLEAKLKETESIMRQHSAQYELKLTRFQEQAEVDKEKAILAVERELRDTLYNQNREDTKELYEKIAKLQEENQKLQIEMAQLKNHK
jgi:chromosome segregation ATPase